MSNSSDNNIFPLISIIVPVHDAATYLKDCIQSLINQTLKEIEIILIENGSTDNSYEICKAFEIRDTRIKVIKGSFSDVSKARNLGMKEAKGTYMAFLDADDYMEPHAYETIIKAMHESRAEAAFFNYRRIGHPNPNVKSTWPSETKKTVSGKWLQKQILKYEAQSSVWVWLVPRSIRESFVLPEGVFYEDHKSTFILARMFNKIVMLEEPLYNYRFVNSSTCSRAVFYAPIRRDHFNAEIFRLDYVLNPNLFGERDKEIECTLFSNCIQYFNGYLGLKRTWNEDSDLKFMRLELQRLAEKIDLKGCSKRIRQEYFCIKYVWYFYRLLFLLRNIK